MSSEIKYVFHDPCELGRGEGIYEQPRTVLRQLGTLVEAKQNLDESICCGGSLGSLSLGFEKREAITRNSLDNLCVAHPDTIVTACPLCQTTFGRYSDVPVKDIAQILDSAVTEKSA
jgi:Fe-S oxidoreductase